MIEFTLSTEKHIYFSVIFFLKEALVEPFVPFKGPNLYPASLYFF